MQQVKIKSYMFIVGSKQNLQLAYDCHVSMTAADKFLFTFNGLSWCSIFWIPIKEEIGKKK